MATVLIDVRDLSDWQMVQLQATENATQRGTTAAASLDAIAAVSEALARDCFTTNADEVNNYSGNLYLAMFAGKVTVLWQDASGRRAWRALYHRGLCRGRLVHTGGKKYTALAVLKDSGHMAAIIAADIGACEGPETVHKDSGRVVGCWGFSVSRIRPTHVHSSPNPAVYAPPYTRRLAPVSRPSAPPRFSGVAEKYTEVYLLTCAGECGS